MEHFWCETEILTIVILDSFSDGFDFTLLTICAWCEKQNSFERCFSTSDAMILFATMTASFFLQANRSRAKNENRIYNQIRLAISNRTPSCFSFSKGGCIWPPSCLWDRGKMERIKTGGEGKGAKGQKKKEKTYCPSPPPSTILHISAWPPPRWSHLLFFPVINQVRFQENT